MFTLKLLLYLKFSAIEGEKNTLIRVKLKCLLVDCENDLFNE